MVDHLTSERRSWNMSRIRSGDTKPEIRVRSLLYELGYRFRLQGKVSKRLHPKGCLPGKPDIVLAKYRTVIFVHGCFWHRHEGCRYTTTPGTRTEWWLAKFERNVARDQNVQSELRELGWHVIIVWECELRNMDVLATRMGREIQRQPKSYPEVRSPELLAAEEVAPYGEGTAPPEDS